MMGADYDNLHPGAGSNGGVFMSNGRTFSLYWSWVTQVAPTDKDVFPAGHHYGGQPIPKRWVRCAMPWSTDVYSDGVAQTFWAPVLSGQPTFEGAGETEDFTPKINTPVLVGFVGNHYAYPVVFGYVSNPDNDHKTGRADLYYRVTRAGHKFVVDSEGKKSLKKIYVESSAGHSFAMYDQDQEADTEKELGSHQGRKRQVYLKDLKGQGLTLFCPQKPAVPVYVELKNAGGVHVLHMQAEPNRFASFSDIEGQFWKFDTDAQEVFVKGNKLVQIKADKAISIVAGSTIDLMSGGPTTVTAPHISLGPGIKLVALDFDPIVGTITSPAGPCTFTLNVKSTAAIVTAS